MPLDLPRDLKFTLSHTLVYPGITEGYVHKWNMFSTMSVAMVIKSCRCTTREHVYVTIVYVHSQLQLH